MIILYEKKVLSTTNKQSLVSYKKKFCTITKRDNNIIENPFERVTVNRRQVRQTTRKPHAYRQNVVEIKIKYCSSAALRNRESACEIELEAGLLTRSIRDLKSENIREAKY